MEGLLSKEVIVIDGAIGTELKKFLTSNDLPVELLNLTDAENVMNLHRLYSEAGAEILTTNTFGANAVRMKFFDVDVYELNKIAVSLAKNFGKLVAGSVGPVLPWLGRRVDEIQVEKIFEEQIAGLSDGGADLILIETMGKVSEMLTAVRVARRVARVPIVVSMAFKILQSGIKTYLGEELKEAVYAMLNSGADVIGANCGGGFKQMVRVIKKFKKLTSFPLIVRPSAGLPKKVSGRLIYQETPDKIAVFVDELLNLGVKIIGGCCGTTPEHIKVIRELVDSSK